MKSTFSKLILAVSFALALAFTTSCSEKDGNNNSTATIIASDSSSSNKNKNTTAIFIDERIVGTWKDEIGLISIFNSDGTGKEQKKKKEYNPWGSDKEKLVYEKFKYAFFSDKIIISSSDHSFVLDYVFSNDGKTIIMHSPIATAWLTKKEPTVKTEEKDNLESAAENARAVAK